VNPRRERFAFGPFLLDEERGMLLRDGEALALTPRAHATLLVLLRSRGRLVAKEELFDTVWRGLHVEENNLSQQISALRRSLGEGWIETVPRRGYRFVGAVRELGGDDAAAAAVTYAPPVAAAAPASRASRAWWVGAFAALAGAAMVVALGFHRAQRAGERPIRSLAVLPFTASAPGDLAEPVGVGLAEAVGERLGSAGALAVRPATAVRAIAGERDAVLAAQRLRVDGVVAGTFRWEAQQVRVEVRLIDGRNGRLRWSGTVAHAASELPRLPEAIAASLAEHLGEDDTGIALRPPPRRRVDPAAYTEYLKGRWRWGRRTKNDLVAAAADFRAAIARDAGYAAAHAGLADALLSQGLHEEARAVATHALALDGSLAEPYATLGFLAWFQDRDGPAATAAFRRAIEISPSYSTAYQWLAFVELSHQRCKQARTAIGRAHELDPLSLIIATDEAHVDYYCGDVASAERKVRAVLRLDPHFGQAHGVLGGVLLEQGRFGEALRAYGEMHRVAGPTGSYPLRVLVHARQGDGAAVDRELALLRRGPLSVQHYTVACVMAWLERREEAWTSLLRSVAAKESDSMLLAVDPYAAALRRDPRVRELMGRLGIDRDPPGAARVAARREQGATQGTPAAEGRRRRLVPLAKLPAESVHVSRVSAAARQRWPSGPLSPRRGERGAGERGVADKPSLVRGGGRTAPLVARSSRTVH
jgi:DNA-binding winged helix-turn-helix (wHTH) protein/tetratricopeptide (TPR) repeat protein